MVQLSTQPCDALEDAARVFGRSCPCSVESPVAPLASNALTSSPSCKGAVRHGQQGQLREQWSCHQRDGPAVKLSSQMRWSSCQAVRPEVVRIIVDCVGRWGSAWPKFNHDKIQRKLQKISLPTLILTFAHGCCAGQPFSLECFGQGSVRALAVLRVTGAAKLPVTFAGVAPEINPHQAHCLEVFSQTLEPVVHLLSCQRSCQKLLCPVHMTELAAAEHRDTPTLSSLLFRHFGFLVKKKEPCKNHVFNPV